MASLEDSVGRWIWVIHRCGRRYLDEKLAPYDIGSAQLRLFGYLMRHGAAHQEALAAHMELDKGATARALDKLEAAGYIERRPDPADRRANLVSLTEKARQVDPEIRQQLLAWSEALTAGFTEEERQQVTSLLRRMAAHAKQAVAELKGMRGG